MQIQSIVPNKLNYYNKMCIDHKAVPAAETHSTKMPSFVDAKSLVNISFKSYFTPLAESIFLVQKEKFDKLIYDPNTNVNEPCGYNNNFPIEFACDKIRDDSPYILEKLLQRPDLDLYPKTRYYFDPLVSMLHREDCDERFITIEKFRIMLQHPCIKTSEYLNYIEKYYNTSTWDRKNMRTPYLEIDAMVKAYQYGVDRRKNIIAFNPVIDAHRILSLDDVWTPEEKAEILKLIDEKDYNKLALIFAEKGFALNEELGKIHELEIQTEKSVREKVTEQIQKAAEEKADQAFQTKYIKLQQEFTQKEQALQAENEKAKQELKQQQEKLDQEKAELEKDKKSVQQQQESYDELMKEFKQLVAEEVDSQTRSTRAYYNDTNNLPENMELDEQLVYVSHPLVANKKKLSGISANTPEKVTEALQNDNKQISKEGLLFIERFLTAVEDSCSELNLINAIKSVKDEIGNINIKKAALFLTKLSWGFRSIDDIIAEVKTSGIKV